MLRGKLLKWLSKAQRGQFARSELRGGIASAPK
jgi:hypothetical protein